MTTLRRPTARHPAVLKHRDHGRLWRLVEGAVVDAFRNHPDFLTVSGHRSAVQSVTKRVVGQLVGHAKQAQGAVGPATGGAGSGGSAAISGAASGAGRHLLPLSRTRWPDLHAALCGGA
ncbi:hypothetical protein R1T40_08500 [Tritonibacter scottomollicae]|uniref:Uncharacterized protein n=1 Tax=Tritonibacter scottomollicae TaxID=483013 RepID=A0ABZ0HIT0_TRISK|nr:hypothetical protein [Tritonibacter scottomollicae]WOI34750.1 hypothetical protein R1T40_08500 [Tritonibacter scottomollicae]